jgi:hypothetical protein
MPPTVETGIQVSTPRPAFFLAGEGRRGSDVEGCCSFRNANLRVQYRTYKNCLGATARVPPDWLIQVYPLSRSRRVRCHGVIRDLWENSREVDWRVSRGAPLGCRWGDPFPVTGLGHFMFAPLSCLLVKRFLPEDDQLFALPTKAFLKIASETLPSVLLLKNCSTTSRTLSRLYSPLRTARSRK